MPSDKRESAHHGHRRVGRPAGCLKELDVAEDAGLPDEEVLIGAKYGPNGACRACAWGSEEAGRGGQRIRLYNPPTSWLDRGREARGMMT